MKTSGIMRASIYKILIIMGMLIGFNNIGNAYITVASSSYQLEVGEEKFLSSPQAYYGYIDHATWACASPYITFVNQASSGATIKVNKAFSGTAVVEVMAVEKYSDNSGKTRSNTYYKQYNISCKGNGPSDNTSEIIMPESIVLSIGETKYFNVVSGNYYRGAYDVTWEERNPVNFAYYNRDYNSGIIGITGMMAGKGTLRIKTASGKEKNITITVNPSDFSNDRRTQAVAIQDIKILTAYLLNNVSIVDDKILIENIVVSPTVMSLEVGSSKDIKVSIYPSNATNQELTWSSSDNSVATVKDGIITAISEGTATVTCMAKDGSGVGASCQVTVTYPEKDGKIVEVNSLRYRIYTSDNSAVVARQLNNLNGVITIPERINYNGTNYIVTEIGDSAFWQQSKITVISIASTVKRIGSYAFLGAKSLASIDIPNNVEAIGRSPFNFCESLESVYIGRGLKTLGIFPFRMCPKLANIEVSAENQYFTSQGGILYSKDHTSVYKVSETLFKVELHPSVQNISNGCFEDNDLIETIDLPDGLLHIYAQAFAYCDNLKSIDIPDNVKDILNIAFKDTKSLKTIKIGKSVVEIGPEVFATKSNYSEVYIRATIPPTIEESTFDNYAATLYVPVGCRSAYANASYWKKFQNIVEYDFDGVEEIVLSDESLKMTVGDTHALTYTITPADAKSKLIWTSSDTNVATVENGVITAVGPGTATITCTADDGNRVSASCQVTVKSLVQEGEYVNVNSLRYRIYPSDHTAVVVNCLTLLSTSRIVTIPERISHRDENYTVTEIGDSAFMNKSTLTGLTISSTIKKIGAYAFRGMSSLISIEIPDNVESIGMESFDFCESLESVYIGRGLKSLGIFPFWCCPKLESIRVSENNQYFTAEENILYSKDHKSVYKVPETMSKVTLHPYVEDIRNGCFADNDLIETIDLPDRLSLIYPQAFAYCDNLKSIDIPDNVTYICLKAFQDCKSLKVIKLGKNIKRIYEEAFATGSKYFEVESRASVPPTIDESTFDFYGATLYVPVGCGNVYDRADYWKKFGTIVEYDFYCIEEIRLSDENLQMTVGDTHTLTYTITPADAKSKLIWASSDTNVATVENGVITAVGPGTATITCTANDGSGVTASCTITVIDDNAVDSIYGDTGITVETGNGMLRISAGRKALVSIYTMNGILIRSVILEADETMEIALTPGAYIVNGVKHMVD